MKNKFIIFTILFIISFCSFSKLNAANYVIGVTGQFGTGASTTDKGKIFNTDFKQFEGSFSIQTGLFFSYYDRVSSVLLLDVGYSMDRYELKNYSDNGRSTENFKLNNISIGLLPRVNFGFLSIGIGGGVKFPFLMNYSLKHENYIKNYDSYTKEMNFNFGDIKNTLENFYYPYIKASVDFLIKGKKRFMMTLGIYANYDFAFNLKRDGILSDIALSKENIASFDIGFEIGLYFIKL